MSFDTGNLTFSFRKEGLIGFSDLVLCGTKSGYQLQTQDSLASNYRLLLDQPDPKLAPDPQLAQLAQQINQLFAAQAAVKVAQKRSALIAAGHPDWAQRLEITCHITKGGLRLGWAFAKEWKEQAPTPRKPLLRRILNPVWPKRVWKMPATAGQKWQTRYIWWPWIFWLLLALGLGYLGWSLAVSDFTPWTPEAEAPSAPLT